MAVGLFTEKTEMRRVVENGAHLRGVWRIKRRGMLRSSWRRNEAAFGGEAVVKPGTAVCQLNLVLRIYDDYVAERSLVPTAAATVIHIHTRY